MSVQRKQNPVHIRLCAYQPAVQKNNSANLWSTAFTQALERRQRRKKILGISIITWGLNAAERISIMTIHMKFTTKQNNNCKVLGAEKLRFCFFGFPVWSAVIFAPKKKKKLYKRRLNWYEVDWAVWWSKKSLEGLVGVGGWDMRLN